MAINDELMLGKTKEELIELAKRYTWFTNGAEQSHYEEPGVIAISQDGRYFTDVFGNKYIEANSGQGGCTLGRSNSYIIDAIIKELKQNPIIITGTGVTTKQILFSQKIAERTPGSLNKVIYGMSGSDANEIAFKVARQYWKIMGEGSKYKVISRWGSYHGGSFGSGSATGYTFRRAPYEPLPIGFIHMNPHNCYECPYKMKYPECRFECAEELRRIIEYEDPSTIAAWIGDLVVTALGPFPAPLEYPKRIREICDEYKILMIVDEVITGWGRMGTWTASEYYGIIPDIITLAKGLSGLYLPLSTTVVKDEITDVFTGKNLLQHIYTMAGNPLSCAAGLAVIEFMEKEHILDRVNEKAVWMKSQAKILEKECEVVGAAYAIGMTLGFQLVKNKGTKERFSDFNAVAKVIKDVGRKNNVAFFPFHGHVSIMPDLTATDQELERIVDALLEALKEVERKFL